MTRRESEGMLLDAGSVEVRISYGESAMEITLASIIDGMKEEGGKEVSCWY